MKLSFRWYGHDDPVTLANIRQIPGIKGIVSAVYDIPVGEVWPIERIEQLKRDIEAYGLELSVIESVPVHEDIKLGRPTRDQYLENFCKTLRNLASCGIRVVCYNFMPLFDWVRTSLRYELPDGSNTLAYDDVMVDGLNLLAPDKPLPAWNTSYGKDEVAELYAIYREMPEETLWENLRCFVEAVMPTAEACGIRMAIHPDDPPWPVLGLPRIVTNQANLERLLRMYRGQNHGLCLCAGSLGSAAENDVPAMARQFGSAGRIHFVHLRNVRRTGPKSFYESGHLSADGSVDMYAVVKTLADTGFDGPVRPDHGRMVWGETGNPGYGLFDRAMGAAYINGLWEAATKSVRQG
ncbi:MAG: mannonate dehydratase [Alicyclobacillus sp.]|nr:mannonate dehydratase [Alicyclobacillus sp.]